MIVDNNKSIGVAYNHLNLPSRVVKTTGESILYIYDALGRKYSQFVLDAPGAQTKITDYEGEFIYENDTLKFINHEEGRVVMTGAEPEYQYHMKDHLGNVRLTFTSKEDIETSTADFESSSADFLYYTEAVKINSEVFDHTDVGSTHYSARLNGTQKNDTD